MTAEKPSDEQEKKVEGAIPDAVREGLTELHKTNPDRERFTPEELILGAWSHYDRPSLRRRLLAGTNMVRSLFGRELKDDSKPSGPFRGPGIPNALESMIEHGEVGLGYEVEGVMVDRKAYLDPEQNGGVRNSLSADKHARYWLVSQVEEQPLNAGISSNGDGPSPNGDQPADPETASPEGEPVFRHVRTLHDPRDSHLM